MPAIYYMRFKRKDLDSHTYFVGSSPPHMRLDAPLFAEVDSEFQDGEVVQAVTVISEANKVSLPKRTLDNSVKAARQGTKSYYLFES